jgi:hypothetical protein
MTEASFSVSLQRGHEKGQNVAVQAQVVYSIRQTRQLVVSSYENGVASGKICSVDLIGDREATSKAAWTISFFVCKHDFVVYDKHGVLCYMPYYLGPVVNPKDIDIILVFSEPSVVTVTGVDYAY